MFGNIPLLGKERANIQALKILQERGADILFATNERWGHEAIQPLLDKLGLRWRPIPVARPLRKAMSTSDLIGVVRDIIAGWWGLFSLARQFQPTHIHTMNEYQTLYNLPVLRLLRRPIIYRLGDAPIETPRLLGVLWRWFVAPSVSTFVCISEFIKAEAMGAGVPEEKIRVIYNYPPERLAHYETDKTAAPWEGKTVLYVGQISKEKGVDLLIEMATTLCEERTDVRFLLAGNYSWNNPFAENLIQRVEALGLSHRIVFLGYVDDVPSLLNSADIHVCPSVGKEALSNVVPEAKQASVPSVVFPSGGLPELVVAQGEDGWVCKGKTVEALRAGIEHYLGMGVEELEAAGRAARRSMEALGITKEHFAEQWMEVYDAV